jgi:hypothetical protein
MSKKELINNPSDFTSVARGQQFRLVYHHPTGYFSLEIDEGILNAFFLQ